jgi:hypothetical protein
MSGLRWSGMGRSRMRRSEGCDNFSGGGLADFAITIVDTALCQRVFAAAGARLRVEFVERDVFLLRSESRKVDAGKFRGALSVLQENLAGILECIHFDIADGQAEERANFRFIENRIAKAFVFLNDASFGVQNERSRQRGDSAVLKADGVSSECDGIVDFEFSDKFLDCVLIIVVHDEAENLQPVFVLILQPDEVGNFRTARPAPGGPEIQENHFAFGVRERDRLSIEAWQFEVWRGVGIANKANRRLAFLLRRSLQRKNAKQQRSNEVKKRPSEMEIPAHGVIYRKAHWGHDAKPRMGAVHQ